jgi:hypothetical protein
VTTAAAGALGLWGSTLGAGSAGGTARVAVHAQAANPNKTSGARIESKHSESAAFGELPAHSHLC